MTDVPQTTQAPPESVRPPAKPPAPYELARVSCRELLLLHDNTTTTSVLSAAIDKTAIAQYALQCDKAVIRDKGSSLANDANFTRVNAVFESVPQEAGLIVLMHALDFGGGWRLALHRHTGGKGAWLTVKAGVERLFDANPTLAADWLESRTVEDVAELFQLPSDSEDELYPFVKKLTNVITEVGDGVQKAGCLTLADWLMTRMKYDDDDDDDDNTKNNTPAGDLVEWLVTNFPYTFNDRHQVDGQDVFFYKKAQLVVGELYHRFRDENDRFAFADGDRLTAFIDNVICAVCRKLGLVVVTPTLAAKIDNHEFLPSGSVDEVSLRAAAMDAVEHVAAETGLTPVEVGNYFWGVLGKTPEFRKYTRHATRDTVFY